MSAALSEVQAVHRSTNPIDNRSCVELAVIRQLTRDKSRPPPFNISKLISVYQSAGVPACNPPVLCHKYVIYLVFLFDVEKLEVFGGTIDKGRIFP